MNRMLVVLVVLLTAGLGVEWVYTLDLKGEIDSLRGRRSQRPAAGSEAAPDAATSEEIEGLRARVRRLEMDLARRSVGAPRASEGGAGERVADASPGSGTAAAPEVRRSVDGAFEFTEAEIEHAMALSREVGRRQQIDRMTRGYMRAIDRLAARGEISALPKEKRDGVEEAVKRFVAGSQTTMTSMFRDPTPEIAALEPTQRRELLRNELDRLRQDAQIEIAAHTSQTDAEKITQSLNLR
ncbi:MAG: hypothetical protein ACE5JG_00400, partial [Planctomycetota bacterium]